MSDFLPFHGASVAVFGATSLDSLASSATWVAGRASAAFPCISNDVLLTGRFKANAIAPTVGSIKIYVGAPLNDTPTYADVFTGADSAKTVTSTDIRDSVLALAATIVTDVTANRVYEFKRVSVAALFGGVLPNNWFVFVTHSMVQALNVTASAGGQCWYTPVTYPRKW
jgi:hypothetical protein